MILRKETETFKTLPNEIVGANFKIRMNDTP